MSSALQRPGNERTSVPFQQKRFTHEGSKNDKTQPRMLSQGRDGRRKQTGGAARGGLAWWDTDTSRLWSASLNRRTTHRRATPVLSPPPYERDGTAGQVPRRCWLHGQS